MKGAAELTIIQYSVMYFLLRPNLKLGAEVMFVSVLLLLLGEGVVGRAELLKLSQSQLLGSE